MPAILPHSAHSCCPGLPALGRGHVRRGLVSSSSPDEGSAYVIGRTS